MEAKNTRSTKKIILNGVAIALVFLATTFTRIPGPVPPGYINFGDAVIMITATLIGKGSGFISGAFGSALADMVAPGGVIFAPFTFIVKGLEGYVIGKIIHDYKQGSNFSKNKELRKIVGLVMGALVMVAGYFIAELSVLRLFDPAFGFAAAVAELPFNLIQGGVSVIIGYLLTTILQKTGIQEYIED
ncbi:MAG TPA: ECF transporter S component [Clostridiaceae bacterium]|nr:ECF transporter S component [Clostridiaceae bacterium]